jgi:hypothetical protein
MTSLVALANSFHASSPHVSWKADGGNKSNFSFPVCGGMYQI